MWLSERAAAAGAAPGPKAAVGALTIGVAWIFYKKGALD